VGITYSKTEHVRWYRLSLKNTPINIITVPIHIFEVQKLFVFMLLI
jgi:hypothetical protein